MAPAILYRGAGLDIVWPEFAATAAIGAVCFVGALPRFRKVLTAMQWWRVRSCMAMPSKLGWTSGCSCQGSVVSGTVHICIVFHQVIDIVSERSFLWSRAMASPASPKHPGF
jgi:hypothetical protein